MRSRSGADLYSCARARTPYREFPPETSTCPFASNVAASPDRAGLRLLVAIQLPVAGSYTSALTRGVGTGEAAGHQHLPIRQQRRGVFGCVQ